MSVQLNTAGAAACGASYRTDSPPAATTVDETAAPDAISDGGAEPTQAEFESHDNFDRDAPLYDSQMGVLSVLVRHQDQFKEHVSLNPDELRKKAQDESLPPDLRKALNDLAADPALRQRLDLAFKAKDDDKMSDKDLTALADRPEFAAFREQQAQTYVQQYVPSDAPKPDGDASAGADLAPRPMQKNDALRELYMYSDSLHRKVGLEDFAAIVSGTFRGKKLPPQVIAAAQYFLQHQDEWKQMMGPRPIKRGDMCNKVSGLVNLKPQELQALEGLKKDKDFFFKDGPITREKLDKMLQDPTLSPERQRLCKALKDDPLLFGLLDNAKRGHNGGGFWSKRKADDGKIGEGDLDAMLAKLTPANRTAPKTPPAAAAPSTPAQKQAAMEMTCGVLDDPDPKKPKGNGGFFKLAGKVMGIVAKIYDVASIALGALAKVPVVGPLFGAASVAAATYAGALRVGKAAIEGGNVKQALKNMALDAGMAVVGALTMPGAGRAMAVAAKEGAKAAIETGTRKLAERGAHELAERGAKEAAERGATELAERGAARAAQSGGREIGEQGARRGAQSVATRGAAREGAERAALEGAEEAAEASTGALIRAELKAAIKDEVRAQLEQVFYEQVDKQCKRLGVPNPLDLKAQLRERAEQMALDFLQRQAEKAGIPTDPNELLAKLPPPLQRAMQHEAVRLATALVQDPQGQVQDMAERAATRGAQEIMA